MRNKIKLRSESPGGPTPVRSIHSDSDGEMGSMEASTAPENGAASAGGGGKACNGAGAVSNGGGGLERRLRSSTASAAWAAHLPLEVGTRVMCRWRDQKLHPVKVIERRKGAASSSPADYEYYVHYTECEGQPPRRTCFSFLGLGLRRTSFWEYLELSFVWVNRISN